MAMEDGLADMENPAGSVTYTCRVMQLASCHGRQVREGWPELNEFVEAVGERVRCARASLREALAAEDAYSVAVAQDELDDVLRLAQAHGIELSAATDNGKGTVQE
ncbi:hypothetical protein [Streptomyces sp. NPDC059063]|uniref:hypothetical protein n=1 Tax=unclassified Streptomyces TaxID=2593676 RepID=UPI0036C6FDE4